MKKLIAVLMLIAGSSFAGVKCNDGWLQTDKVAHFGIGFVSGSVIEALGGGTKPVWPILSTMALASMKESIDHETTNEKTGKRINHWCWKDWSCTVLGGVAGVYTIRLGIHIYRSENSYVVAKTIKF